MAMAQNITVIPARRKVGTQKPAETKQKTRVAAYCRVSTEFEEQESSYEVKVKHYTSYIKSNPEWELVEVYEDDGISATNTAKRESFNRMIQDCRDGKIDMILTKSISRFSRNTVDCLKYTRELKGLNIAVFFEKDNINTLDANGDGFILKRIQNETSAYRLRRLEIRGFRASRGLSVMMGEMDFRVGYENGAGAGVCIREKFPKVVCRNLNTGNG